MTVDKITLEGSAKIKGLNEIAKELDEILTLGARAQQLFKKYELKVQGTAGASGGSLKELRDFYKNISMWSKGSPRDVAALANIARATNKVKAEFKDLNAVVVGTKNSAVNEKIRAYKVIRDYAAAGLTLDKASKAPIEDVVKALESSNLARRKAETTQQRLNTLQEQYSRKVVEFESKQKALSGNLGQDQSAIHALNIQKAKNDLELNLISIKKAQVLEDQKEINLLKEKRTGLQSLLLQEQKLYADSKKRIAEAAKTPKNLVQSIQTHREAMVQALNQDSGASLFKVQASLIANYTLMNQLFNLFNFGSQFVLQLNNSFANLQATIGATSGQMEALKSSIITTSQNTKFSAVEVSQAALVLGQAGLSLDQIKESLNGVAMLATATGSSLQESVDVFTTGISVFNLRAEDGTHIANVMTEAINKTKLSMDKLALGFQYVGNIAEESGMTLEETTALLGAMSNAGIKSGSTLGTGLRQLLTEFMAPSEKLAKALHNVGLSAEDVDVKSKGFTGVLKTLSEAGFSAADAFETLDLRAAAAFSAILNQPEVLNNLTKSFLYSNAAVKANDVQMEDLLNTLTRLANSTGTLINTAFKPLVNTLQGVASSTADALNWLNQFGSAISFVGTAMGAFGLAVAGIRLTSLITNLAGVKSSTDALSVSFNASAASTTKFQGLLSGLISKNLLVTGAILALTYAYGKFTEAQRAAEEAVSKAEEAVSSSEEALGTTNTTITSIDQSITRLTSRYAELAKDQEGVKLESLALKNQFADLGLTVEGGLSPSIDNLISSLRNLRQEMEKVGIEQVKQMMIDKASLLQKQAALAAEKQQKAAKDIDVKQAFSQYNGTYDIGSKVTSNLLKKSYATSAKISQISGLGEDTVSSKELVSLEADVNALRDELNQWLFKVSSKVKNMRSAQKRGESINENVLTDLEDEEAALRQAISDTTVQAKGIMELQVTQQEKLNRVFSQTNLSKTADDFIQAQQQKISNLQKEIRDSKDGSEKDAKMAELKALVSSMETDILQQIATNLKMSKEELLLQASSQMGQLGVSGVTEASVSSLLSSRFNPEINATIGETKTKLDHAAGDVKDAMETASDKARNFIDTQKEIFDRLSKSYETQSSALDFIIQESSDIENGGLAGKYSDAELAIFERRKKSLKIQGIKAKLAGGSDYISAYDKAISESQKAIGNTRDPLEKAKGEKELIKLMQERADAQDELNLLQSEYNALTGVTVEKNISLVEQAKDVLDSYQKQMDIQSQWSYNLKTNIVGALDEAKSSFSDFVYNIVTGTETVGSSFKKLAASILESMLNTQIEKLSSGLMGSAVGFASSALGSLFGFSSSSGTSIPGSIDGTSYMLATGGFVRKASGGITTRDSVATLLRPGEYVLRNQAVDAIGRDTLDNINAMGARAVSTSGEAVSSSSQASSNNKSIASTNVYVVSPEQKPSLTRNDVIVTITEDMLKGGQTKKLVKSIVQGGL